MEENKSEAEKPENLEKKAKIIVYSLIIILLGFGLFLFVSQKIKPGTTQYVHNKDTFDIQQVGTTKEGGISYRIKIFTNNDPSPKYIHTRYEPKQMDGLKIDPNVKNAVLTKKIAYATINPNDQRLKGKTTIAVMEINNILDNAYLFKIPLNSAFTEFYENDANHTIKTCNDVNKDTAVIWLKLGEETAIKEDKGCVILEGRTEDDLVKLADGLMFYLMDMVS